MLFYLLNLKKKKLNSPILENCQKTICMHGFFSNPCGQVLKSIKYRGQICPILLRRKKTFPHKLENNHACKWILDNFPGIIHTSEFLENCPKFICMHCCSPTYVERSWSPDLRVQHNRHRICYTYQMN